jgi:uncharacterized repeat protein (TIGR03847 family)
MARRLFIFDPPDRFVAGTVGGPGQRTFYLQARRGQRIVSVSLEKVQVAVLADRLTALLDELERRGIADVPAVAEPLAAGADVRPLDEPLNEAFRAGTLTLGWDGDDDVVVVEAREAGDADDPAEAAEAAEIPDDDESGPDLVRVRLPAAVARSFAERAGRILAAGRPPCPLCGEPLDPRGHLCPRRNGAFLN